MLIVNADDFGLSEDINRAILQSFKKGLCSSTTLMSNMPAFEDACQLAHENKLINHIGMHLVLRDGFPLTEKIKKSSKFCTSEGQLCTPNSYYFGLEKTEREALAEEIRAQIRRCRAYKIPITHIDSHQHIHKAWDIATVLIYIAKQENIPYVRTFRLYVSWYMREVSIYGVCVSLRNLIYNYMFHSRLRIRGLARTEYFGTIDTFNFLKKQVKSANAIESFEIMVHPVFNDRGLLINRGDYREGRTLEDIIKEIDSYKDIVSFSGAKYL